MKKIYEVNAEIRDLMYHNRITQWMLAKALGVCEGTVQRKLREELSEKDRVIWMLAIKKLVEGE